MKEDKREYIIRKAMELYALKGYQNSTITDLQNALDIGRGTLYYYFKDQEDLFYTCMERYFLEPKQKAIRSIPENAGIDDVIKAMLTYVDEIEQSLLTFTNKQINTSNSNGLMLQAYNMFPAMRRKAKRLALTELHLWRQAIYHDQRAGLIRHDIDVEQVSLMFTYIKSSFDAGLADTQMDFSLIRKSYSEFHKLLKI